MSRYAGVLPTTPAERVAMFCAYALVGLLWWMVTHRDEVFAFFIGGW